ncbi:MAG: type II secretion system protein N [Burkholderiaceae bacterium]
MSALLSFALLALLTALLVFWGMQLAAPRVTIAPSGSLVDQSGRLDTMTAGRLFGVAGQASPAQARLPDNIKVLGVIASASRSAAVLQVNGQPAAPYAIGQSVDGTLTVKNVSRDEVVLDRDGEELRAPAPARYDASILAGGAQPGEARNEDTGRNMAAPRPPGGASAGPTPRRLAPSPSSAGRSATANAPQNRRPVAPAVGNRQGAGMALKAEAAAARGSGG